MCVCVCMYVCVWCMSVHCSYKTLLTFLLTKCGDSFPHNNKHVSNTSWGFYSLTQFDSVYPERASDPTGWGLSPMGLLGVSDWCSLNQRGAGVGGWTHQLLCTLRRSILRCVLYRVSQRVPQRSDRAPGHTGDPFIDKPLLSLPPFLILLSHPLTGLLRTKSQLYSLHQNRCLRPSLADPYLTYFMEKF